MGYYDSFGDSSGLHVVEDARVRIYAVADPGKRRDMEDGCAIATALPSDSSFVGVFDGHGGNDAARYCTANLLKFLASDEQFARGAIPESLHSVFLKVDDEVQRHESASGTTAIVLVVKKDRFFVAHAGDSYCSLMKNSKMVHLTKDHVPGSLDEADRARKSKCLIQDGVLSKMGSWNTLAVTRAIGDFEFKDNPKKPREEQAVIAVPDVLEEEISDGCEFLVIASDGLEREYIEKCQAEIRKALAEMNSSALRDIVLRRQSKDNKTMVVVEFLKGRSSSDKRKKIEDDSRPGDYRREREFGDDRRRKNSHGYDRRRDLRDRDEYYRRENDRRERDRRYGYRRSPHRTNQSSRDC